MIDISNKNYYELLGVSRRSSTDEIRDAYKEIARIYHPDSTFYSEIAKVELTEADAEVFRIITNAYNILSHPDRREKYDRTLPKDETPDIEDEYFSISDEDLVRQAQDTAYEWREVVPTYHNNGENRKTSRDSSTFDTFGKLDSSPRASRKPYRGASTRGKAQSINDMINERKKRIRNKVLVIVVIGSAMVGLGVASLVIWFV